MPSLHGRSLPRALPTLALARKRAGPGRLPCMQIHSPAALSLPTRASGAPFNFKPPKQSNRPSTFGTARARGLAAKSGSLRSKIRNKRGRFARCARSNGINGKVCRCRGYVESKRQPGWCWCARGPAARTRTPGPPRPHSADTCTLSPTPFPHRLIRAKYQPCSARARAGKPDSGRTWQLSRPPHSTPFHAGLPSTL